MQTRPKQKHTGTTNMVDSEAGEQGILQEDRDGYRIELN